MYGSWIIADNYNHYLMIATSVILLVGFLSQCYRRDNKDDTCHWPYFAVALFWVNPVTVSFTFVFLKHLPILIIPIAVFSLLHFAGVGVKLFKHKIK